MAGKSLAITKIITPLVCTAIVDNLTRENRAIHEAAAKGRPMYTFKARELASVIAEGANSAQSQWQEVIYNDYGYYVNKWQPYGAMTYRATGNNPILEIMQNVSQLLTEKGFRVDFSWEKLNEYTPFNSDRKEPDTAWSTEYECRRTITIYNASAKAYPELELPTWKSSEVGKNTQSVAKADEKKAWMQVRPAMNVRWGEPEAEEIQVLAKKILYELTASEEAKVLEEAVDLDSDNRMLRIDR